MSQFAAWLSALALQVLPLWLLIPDYTLRLRKGMPSGAGLGLRLCPAPNKYRTSLTSLTGAHDSTIRGSFIWLEI